MMRTLLCLVLVVAACAREQPRAPVSAAERYAGVRDRHRKSEDVRDASFQLCEVLVQLERWPDVLEVSEELLTREDLSSAERLEALQASAYDPKSHKKIEMITLGG